MPKIFIITGPSGAGKDTLIDALKENNLEFERVITSTSRPQRAGESQGHPYYFVSKDEFIHHVENNEMFEYARVYDNYYGVTKKEIERVQKQDKPVIWKVDVQGMITLKKKIPESLSIFIKPENPAALREWITRRAKDTPEIIEHRLRIAQQELDFTQKADFVVTNYDSQIEKAAQELADLIKKHNL